MTVSLKHIFQSAKDDSADPTIIQPSNWNEEHELTAAAGKVLGRDTSGAGAVQELPISVSPAGNVSIPNDFAVTGTSALTNLGVTGTTTLTNALTVPNGGTGAATLAANGLLIGNGTSAVSAVAPGPSGYVLLSSGPSSPPTWSNIQSGSLPFTASGSITAGQPVCLRSDGAVEVATGFQQTETLGAAQNSLNGTSAKQKLVVSIPNTSNLLVVTDNGTTAQVVVATVSGSTITYGGFVTAPWNALSLSNESIACVYDPVSNSFLFTYCAGSILYGVVCTVSGTTVTFGTQQSLVTGLSSTQRVASCYDSLRQQCVIGLAYIPSNRNFDIWRATISGTVITVAGQFTVSTGSGFNFEGANLLYDSIVNRIVFVGGMTLINNIQLISNSGTAFANVGSAVALGIAPVEQGVAYDTVNNKYVAVNADGSGNPAVRSFSITASTITVDAAPTVAVLPSTTVANTTTPNGPKVSYDAITGRMVYLYYANTNTVFYNTSSGFGASMTFTSYGTAISNRNPRLTYLPQQNRTVILVIKDSAPTAGPNLYSFLPAADTTNTQNFIGFATSTVTNGQPIIVTVQGGLNTSQTGLTTGANYFLNTLGALVTTGGVRVGEALSATSMFVEGKLAGAGTPSASTFLRGDGVFAAAGATQMVVFESSGTWSIPAGLASAFIYVTGGGGGATSSPRSGGAAGGTAVGYVALTGSTASITIGAGGTGGGTGGNTTFVNGTTTFTGNGGAGGSSSFSGTLGGTASGGQPNIVGGDGGCDNSSGDGGIGGSSFWGGGGGPGRSGNSGNSARAFGAGAGGGPAGGGNGKSGVVVIIY